MKIILLGTNGWYDTHTGNTISILLQTKDYNIIFDAGNGIYKLENHINSQKKSEAYLLLSHFHLDHINGLHILCKFNFLSHMHIGGPKGTNEILNNFLASPYTVPIEKLPYKVHMYEMPEEEHKMPFKIRSLPLEHADLTLGYRIETEGKIIAYCPDTGYCKNAVKLAEGADILITECSFKSGQSLKEWPHLNPESAAQIAKEGKVKKLVLVHFASNIYGTIEEREKAAEDAKKIFNETIAGTDCMEIRV